MKKYLCLFALCGLLCSCVKNFDPDLVDTTPEEELIDEIFTVEGVSFTMKPVSGGTFEMGSLSGSIDERPVHSVTLSTYYIGETEVTQELWQAVMGSNPSRFTGSQRPVEQVSWNDCQEFIEQLNALTGKKFRLPTEAEWEYAARGGNKSKGYIYSGSNDVDAVAWYSDNIESSTHEVKGKLPNELGLYDMSGNVWEWCSDWYDSYSAESATNPQGPSSGSNRVFRGGGWGNNADRCRCANRSNGTPADMDDALGLRLVFQQRRGNHFLHLLLSRIRHRRYEGSHVFARLGRDSSVLCTSE